MNCPDCDVEFPTEMQMKIHRHLEHGDTGDSGVTDEPDIATTTEDDESAPVFGESPPKRAKIRDRFKAKLTVPSSGLAKRREPGAAALALGWSGVGTLLIRTQVDVPVGRTLQFQADIAGETLDRLIAHTFLDRLLQPIAKNVGAMEEIGSLIALPMLVGAIERNPEAAPMLEPMLRTAVMANLTQLAPLVKKKKAEEAKFAKAVKDLDLGLEPGADPVEAVLNAIFAPPPGMENTNAAATATT